MNEIYAVLIIATVIGVPVLGALLLIVFGILEVSRDDD